MPHGIDEALFPRFSSQAGREIVPVVTTEGARELALRRLTHRLVSCGRKTDDLSAIRCVADKDPLFLLTWKRSSRCDNHAGIQVGSSHCPSFSRHLGTGFFTERLRFHRMNFSSSCLRTASAHSRGSGGCAIFSVRPGAHVALIRGLQLPSREPTADAKQKRCKTKVETVPLQELIQQFQPHFLCTLPPSSQTDLIII